MWTFVRGARLRCFALEATGEPERDPSSGTVVKGQGVKATN